MLNKNKDIQHNIQFCYNTLVNVIDDLYLHGANDVFFVLQGNQYMNSMKSEKQGGNNTTTFGNV